MQNIKCVVVGDAGVGKTCMLIAYTNNAFPGEYVPKSFGENMGANVMIDSRPFNLGLWDTAAGGDYDHVDRLRPLSYANTDVFLICFTVNRRSSFTSVATKWVEEIMHHCPGTPFIIVGTRIDIRDSPSDHLGSSEQDLGPDPVTFEEAESKAKKIGAARYVECSALTQKGLKEVFETAIRVVIDPSFRYIKKKDKECIVQ